MIKKFNQLDKTHGFGKGVNDYLNHYVTVADAKSAALIATNLIVFGALDNFDLSKYNSCFLKTTFILLNLTSLISILISLFSLFPRLNYDNKKGLIFWESIQNYSDVEEYIDDYKNLSEESVEEEYAKQNYFVSKVLKQKNSHIRNAIYFLVISIIVGLISLIFIKFNFLW